MLQTLRTVKLAGTVVVLGTVLSCKATAPIESEVSADDATRALIGMDHPYPAQPLSKPDLDALDHSFVKRRLLGWQMAHRLFEPVALSGANSSFLPRWQAWYTADEVEKMFVSLYLALPPQDRVTEKLGPHPRRVGPVKREVVDCVLGQYMSEQRLKERYGKLRYQQLIVNRIAQLKERTPNSLNGVAKGATLFNLAFVRHLLENYAQIVRCTDKTTAADGGDPFSPCFFKDFPDDAVAVKAIWTRDDEDLELFDTSGEGIKAALKNKRVWQPRGADGVNKIPASDPKLDELMYTTQLRNTDNTENRYRLSGIHFMTKEAREWVWLTMWWAQNPTADFGEDRPEWFGKYSKGSVTGIRNYKMCVVTGYKEQDQDMMARIKLAQSGELRPAADSLMAAALATYTNGANNLVGASSGQQGSVQSWCSNPYIEKDHGMADTNCIACHQHAAPDSEMHLVRHRMRENFPADYSWSFQFYTDMVGKENDNFQYKFQRAGERFATEPQKVCSAD